MGCPERRCQASGDDGLYGSVGGILCDIADRLAQCAKFGEHTNHDKGDVNKAGGGIDGLGVFDESDDDLAKAEVYGTAEESGEETEDITAEREGDIVKFITDDKGDDGHNGDHDQLDGEAAGHDGPVGGWGYPKTLEDAFVAVPGYRVGIAEESDGCEADGNTVR